MPIYITWVADPKGEKTKMKKNRTMRIAAVMLVFALLTTCIISGSFAKYTTSGQITDTARVAKWGVEFTTTGDSVFKGNYDNTVSVAAGSTEKLVAPGTANATGTTLTVSGTSEVKFKVGFDMAITSDVLLPVGTYLDYTTADPDDTFTTTAPYNPVVYTLVTTKDGTSTTVSGTLAEIKDAVDAMTDLTFNPGNSVNVSFKLTWAWVFPETSTPAIDQKDTLLGSVANSKPAVPTAQTAPDTLSTDINFAITLSATQMD